jgi:hypothetical protein
MLGMGPRNDVNTRRSDQRRKDQNSSDHFTRARHWCALTVASIKWRAKKGAGARPAPISIS